MSAFDKIIGYEDVKTELMRFCDVLKDPERYRKLGVKIPRGIVLEGRPGVGKTMMSKCFIEESGCKAYVIRKDKPNGEFVNEIRSTFEKAKKDGKVIVFLDDMDKFANEDERHTDAEEYVTVQACIDDCRDKDVFVLATINYHNCLPDSLMRPGRFDKNIYIPEPKGEDARKIINYYIKQKKVMEDIDIGLLSRLMEGKTCATLETVINEAGIYAGYDKRESINQSDMIRACMRSFFNAPEATEDSDEKSIRGVAIHEAGHAVVGEIMKAESVSLVSVCRYYGPIEGVTVYHGDGDFRVTKEEYDQDLIRLLGGKAATEIVLGKVDIGSVRDLSNAFNLLEKIVDDHCSYGFDAFVKDDSSDYTRVNKDRRVASEMERYYTIAKQIIIENRAFFDALVEELIEKKTLLYTDIQAIKQRVYNDKVA